MRWVSAGIALEGRLSVYGQGKSIDLNRFFLGLTKNPSSGKGTACIRCTKLKKKCRMMEVESRGRKRQRGQVVSEAKLEVVARPGSVGRRVKGKRRAEAESELEAEAETEKEKEKEVEGWRLVLERMKQMEEWMNRMEARMGSMEKVLEKIPTKVLTGVMTQLDDPTWGKQHFDAWKMDMETEEGEEFPEMNWDLEVDGLVAEAEEAKVEEAAEWDEVSRSEYQEGDD